MNNIKTKAVSPDNKNPLISIARISWLLLIAFVAAAIGLFFILTFSGMSWVKWIVLPIVIAITVVAMKALSPSEIKGNLNRQYKNFWQ